MSELERFAAQLRDSIDGLVNTVMQFQEQKTTAKIHSSTLELLVGSIEEQEVDAIVNATGTSLAAGSGIDADIHRAAGPQLAAASRALAPCRAGDAVLTPGFRLPAPWVIHTVSPIYAGGYQDEAAILDQAYRSCLTLAARSGLTQIALPSIGTDSYGYPIEEAAKIALGAVLEFIDGYRNSELLIRLVLSSRADFNVYDQVLRAFAQTDAPSPAATESDEEDDVVVSTASGGASNGEAQPWRYQSTSTAIPESDAAVSTEPDFVLTLEPETVLSVEPEPVLSVEPMPVLSVEPETVLSVDLPVESPVYYDPEREDFAAEDEEEEEFTLTQEERDAARGELVSALQGLEAARAGFEEEVRQAEEEERARLDEVIAQAPANAAVQDEEDVTEADGSEIDDLGAGNSEPDETPSAISSQAEKESA